MTMTETKELQETPQGQLKAQTEEEFLVRIGAKEEKFDWNPNITNERLVRSRSFACAEYTHVPGYKQQSKIVTGSPWVINSQAARQLSLSPRFGPRRFFYNNQNIHNIQKTYLQREETQTMGLCYSPATVLNL